ncbi:hypothetical protein ACFLUY_00465 [Chloroflexota bacterium]
MNEIVIFCESYPQIKNALYLAGHNPHNHSVTVVITGLKNLYKFFNLINEKIFQGTLNIIYFSIYRGRIANAGNRIIKAFYLLPDILKEKRHLKYIFYKHFAQLKDSEIFFFGRHFNPTTFYLLKRLSKANRLVYIPDPIYDVVPIPKSAPSSLAELLHLAQGKSVYGHEIVMGKHPLGKKALGMPDKFFNENVSKVISQEERDTMLKDFDISRFKIFDSGNYRVMYFHDDLDDLIEYDYISDAIAFEERLTEIFNIMAKYFPENRVALKYHPASRERRDMISFGKRLPDFIPAEFLYHEKVKMYLGLMSVALANVEKGVVVSLIDLISFRDDIIREQVKKILIEESHSEILFPKSLDELDKILVNLTD